MTEAEFHQQRERIEAIYTAVVEALRMDEWTLRTCYMNDTRASDNGDKTLAEVNTNWEYREAYVSIFVPDMAECTDAEIQSHLIHELMHVAVNEMREWQDADDGNSHSLRRAKKHEERVVSSLVRMLRSAVLNAQEGRWVLGRIDGSKENDAGASGDGGGEGGPSVQGESVSADDTVQAESSATIGRTSGPGRRKGRR